MPDFIVPLKDIRGNRLYAEDGSIWALYTLSGVVYNMYQPNTIRSAQLSQQGFFQALAAAPGSEYLILGMKARTSPKDILRACVAGLPGFTKDRYAALFDQFQHFYREYEHGVRNEYRREYFLAVKLGAEQGGFDKAVGREMAAPDERSLDELERKMFEAIPPEYRPARGTPHHVRWIHQRFMSRGRTIPYALTDASPEASFGPKSFPAMIFDKNAQVDAYADDFADKFNRGIRAKARDWFIGNWRTAQESTMCAVIDPDARTADRPEGAVSYQKLMAILSYPTTESKALNHFTGIVDQEIFLDADFAQRITFDRHAVTKDGIRHTRARLGEEAGAIAEDELDMQDYQDSGTEMVAWHAQARKDRAQVAIKVATIYAFAHPDWRYLEQQTAAVQTALSNEGYDLRTLPGAEEELFKLMAPGQPLGALGEALQQTSTIQKFAASMPIRSTRIGSETGFPIAINKENSLCQIVRMNLMRSTEAGSGSIAASGEPRGGKSYFIKTLAYAYLDMGAHEHIIDMSTHGEYAVAARALPAGASVTVHVAAATHSMDPLRVYADDPETARDIFLDLWLPMLGINARTDAGTQLINILTSRAGGTITSTRDLVQYLSAVGPNRPAGDPLRELYSAFLPYANSSWARLLIDPLDSSTGAPAPLPLLQRDDPRRLVVFRTHNLSTPDKDKAVKQPRELFSEAAYLAIAFYTQQRFSRIADVCVTIADEVAFLGGEVPTLLIKTPDKMGAKEKNLVIAATQNARDLGDEYSLIPTRVVFRQREQQLAEEALMWGNVPVTPSTLKHITTDMSPLDVSGEKVLAGREGECYLQHNGIARVRMLPMPPKRARLADTTASRMIREDDLVAQS
ncbi:ATP-binding protein [Gordonia alkaliphila]|uniref:ATP-binding protein n=1 Tax=Gordonia alkaliphila TaxID=1053547 RepID=UPI001FF1DE26|nr:ATP-binding protein [Gordonia alkaliphila]MCK0441130.1 ATP-binding protein [Gordonia alkaliphila]